MFPVSKSKSINRTEWEKGKAIIALLQISERPQRRIQNPCRIHVELPLHFSLLCSQIPLLEGYPQGHS